MEELISSYKNGDLILFVGAGISKNLNLPDWSQLMDQIANDLGYDPAVFKTFGDFPALAEYYRLQKGSIGPLRSWMDTNWHSSDIKVEDSEIHKLITISKFPIIYTTNYDRWIERAFEYYDKDYTKIANVSDMAKITDGISQIVKFHGDFDDDSSLVLDETSYFDRFEFESPLDIKLRSDVLGKSVLFIGYSLTDVNIRLLFYKLSKLWKRYSPNSRQKKSYVFTHRPNPIQEAVLDQWGINMITSEDVEPKEALVNFLKKLRSE